MFTEDLARLRDSGRLAGIHTNSRDPAKFDVGRILAFDDDFFAMTSISKFGKLDGVILQENENIIQIDEGSSYLNMISALQRYYNEKPYAVSIGQYPVFDLLGYCHINSRIVSVEILGSGNNDVIGYVEELDIDKCVVRQIADDGKSDGTASILLKDITFLSCCSGAEVMLEVLSSELFDEVRKN